ncbi:MAG: matrixin family metalloprotease [Proteobacteria bacterium]|nr:matrixin family metalloprotease [Pseudomonadota bacterium]
MFTDKMKSSRPIVLLTWLTVIISTINLGCSDMDGAYDDSSAESGEYIGAYRVGLELGANGEDVEAVYDYLHTYGYFPNEELASQYPSWESVIEEDVADPGVFDETMENAVMEFQSRAGLNPSGIIDGDTATIMNSDRCSFPDSFHGNHRQKWDISSTLWDTPNLSYSVEYPSYLGEVYDPVNGPLNETQILNAVSSAVDTWAASSGFEFNPAPPPPLSTCSKHIYFQIYKGDIPGATPGAHGANFAAIPCFSRIAIAGNHPWVTGTTNPVDDERDFNSAVLHEIGHALGLGHSSRGGSQCIPQEPCEGSPVMRFRQGTTVKRELTIDDRIAIKVIKPGFESVYGYATSIDAGGDGSLWVTGGNHIWWGYDVFRYDLSASSWEHIPSGGAIDIAVDGEGQAWVVTDWGGIYQRNLSNNTWVYRPLPFPWGAVGIAAGGAMVLALGNGGTPTTRPVYGWAGSSWIQIPNTYARDIAVDSNGIAYYLSEARKISIYYPNQSGSWVELPVQPQADVESISTGADGSLLALGDPISYPGGLTAYIYNHQQQVTFTKPNGTTSEVARERNTWVEMEGGGCTGITVTTDGEIWRIKSAGTIDRSEAPPIQP